MSEKKLDETQPVGAPYDTEPNIVVNDYGATRDSAVVVEEAGRTVLRVELVLVQQEAQHRITLAALAKALGGGWSGK